MKCNSWIKKQITYLNSNVGLYKYKGNKFYFEPTEEFYNSISKQDFNVINKVIHKMSQFVECKIEPHFGGWINSTGFIIKEDNIVSSEPDKRAGYIETKNIYDSKIYFKTKYFSEPCILGAILAHEITHHVLYERRLLYKDKDENEKLTDIAAVFFGLGKLLLNGYSKEKYKIGYVSYEKLVDTNIEVCKLRSIDISKLKKNLNNRAAIAVNKSYSYYKRRERINQFKENLYSLGKKILYPFKRKNIQSKESNENDTQKNRAKDFVIINCGKCGQKMRIPKKEKTIKIKCPNCKEEYFIKPKK